MPRDGISQSEQLRRRLIAIGGRGYKAYKQIEGAYDFGSYLLFIDHAQADPFAPPSAVRVRIDQPVAQIPAELLTSRPRQTAVADYLARQFKTNLRSEIKGHRGSGKSGMIFIDAGQQEVLERTAMIVSEKFIEARISVGLPAYGRTVQAREALEIFFHELPTVIERSLLPRTLNLNALRQHVAVVEDQEVLRDRLDTMGLVAFVGDGAILPRFSGASDRPLPTDRAVAFIAPASLRVEVELPNAGTSTGMGISKGVTLIVGGGYHGKSTLLRAMERGIYNHIPGDGRERVVTVTGAVKIRAEDGRSVEKVDITPFIANLPFGKSTADFSTDDASGSTSQAANILEALEVGATLLLLDEDTSATNFMVRDARMQALVAKEKEPITPFIDRVRELYTEQGISTILVMGGSGDYFDVADTIIMMDQFTPVDVTAQAKEIVRQRPTERRQESPAPLTPPPARIPLPQSFPRPQPGKPLKVQAKELHHISFAKQVIGLSLVEQLVDESQTRAIAAALVYGVRNSIDGQHTMEEIVQAFERNVLEHGLDHLSYSGYPHGDLALPRRFELAAAINRLRGLRMQQQK
ncbi:MAG: ABC-ATPase domain-containing protein [Acidobacteria bacterium]|nr:ABC-ATPase domain-containing protein [Acidobacteriota bacterium]